MRYCTLPLVPRMDLLARSMSRVMILFFRDNLKSHHGTRQIMNLSRQIVILEDVHMVTFC